MTDVLIVEDNAELSGLLADFLRAEGYTAAEAASGEAALERFERDGARLVVLDILLPGMDGFAVCRRLREQSDVPILIVSAKTAKDDKLDGLMLGADDYIEKPYDIDILLAKIKGIFKRRYERGVLTDGDVRIDPVKRLAWRDGEELTLSSKEFDLLLLLVENKGATLKKDWIFGKVWGLDSFSEPQTLTVHINKLRQKLGDDAKEPTRIKTVWGVGYRFEQVEP